MSNLKITKFCQRTKLISYNKVKYNWFRVLLLI